MELELIGPHPFERDGNGGQRTRIGTLFPGYHALYTAPPGVHVQQRINFVAHLNTRRAMAGQPPLNADEERRVYEAGVDLIFDPDQILIRPDPEQMELAFQADEQLWELVSKRQVKYLLVCDPRVRNAILERGECWRLSSIPKTLEGKLSWIGNSKVAIQYQPIYYHNRLTGTRFLTFAELEKLGGLDPLSLARQLQEIADYAARRNHLDQPELAFFMADSRRLGRALFAGVDFGQLSPEALRVRYEELKECFRAAVAHEVFRKDNCGDRAWVDRMIESLFLDGCESQTEHLVGGLGPEFFLQIEWLPGGHFEEGEFVLDPIFDEAASHPEDEKLQLLCEPVAGGIIFNFLREHGDLEYINIGRLPESLSQGRPQSRGRRGVYLALFKSRSQPEPIKRFIRLQKWGIWHRLDDGKPLLQAIEESEEYTDYWLDRRLGCRQLGMNLTRQVTVRRFCERYQGKNLQYRGRPIYTTYFERDYLEGIATDKLTPERLARPGYAATFAQLLGKAAASSLIVGRSLLVDELPDGAPPPAPGRPPMRPVFDDGDEVVLEEAGMPVDIFIGDHSGAFAEYETPLAAFAAHYAKPAYQRAKFLPDPREFARQYLEAFRAQFLHIQGDYRKRRRAFDQLFKHCPYDPKGSYAFRWECVLRRLDTTDADKLVEAIRQHIWVLNPDKQLNSMAPIPDMNLFPA